MSADFKLPEGIQLDHFGHGRPEEFELFDGRVVRGTFRVSNSKFIVKPALGYVFRAAYNFHTDQESFIAVKVLDVPLTYTITVAVTDSHVERKVRTSVEWLNKEGIAAVLKESGANEGD